jgi:ankyrin repeat protein
MAAELIDAIKARQKGRVLELLAQDRAVALERDENGVSALMLSHYYGLDADVVDTLRGARDELDVFEAATLGELDRLRELLDEDPTLATARSSDDGTALHFAAFFGQPQAAAILLERGADVHAVASTFGNVTPLHSAAAAPSREIVRMLLEAGADANARQGGGFTALQAAAQNGDPEMARDLLEHGADRSAATDDGRTALSIAEEQGHEEVATLLRTRA